MRYTVLGRTGLRISVVGFGGIPIRRLAHAEGVAVVRRAFALGVTYYDTARGYGDSEDKIGEALRDVRERVV
ncbi:MAG: aldo/keto reductase, partial [Chloroflexota bacterium]